MKAILQAWQDVKDEMIVFFDELHLVFGAITGEKSNIDAASLLKPALACGDLRCIGSTITDEYFCVLRRSCLRRNSCACSCMRGMNHLILLSASRNLCRYPTRLLDRFNRQEVCLLPHQEHHQQHLHQKVSSCHQEAS